MPPTTPVKKSVRLSPEAIAILEAYAATHNCTQTDAINAIILASATTHTHLAATQLPPIVTPQDHQWRRSIEVRLSKLEAATQVPPSIATHSDKDHPSFEVGQVITGQHSKRYNLLHNSKEVHQQQDKLHYYLSNKLGIIFYQYGKSKAGRAIYKVAYCFPGERVVLDTEGKFFTTAFTSELGWFTESELAALAEPTVPTELVNDEIAIEAVEVASPPQNEPAFAQLTEVVDPLVEAATQVPPTRLSTEELLDQFKPNLANPGMVNTIRTNLGQVKLKNLLNGWTAKHDPEGRVWIPENETREYWVERPMEVAS